MLTNQETCTGLDLEFLRNFTEEYDRLAEMLGLFDVDTVAAGTALFQYVVTGELNADVPGEGETTPLSLFKTQKVPLDPIGITRYAKGTTMEAILKSGFENAVLKTDRKFGISLRDVILTNFFTFLGNGEGTASAPTLQALLARADANLLDELEENHDSSESLVHFVSRQDVADYLGDREISTQTAFGLTYLQDFLGVENVIVTSKVAKGDVFVTPAENIHVYGVDFAALGDAGLEYELDANGLIGVHHVPDYDHGAAETFAVLGALFVPEALNYIVKGTISAASSGGSDSGSQGGSGGSGTGTETPSAALSALTIGSLTLTPEFAAGTTAYTATTSNASNKVTATAEDEEATVAITLGESTEVENGGSATWAEGENTLTIVVTNGTETETYTVTVTKE